jgi:hypothetical protein
MEDDNDVFACEDWTGDAKHPRSSESKRSDCQDLNINEDWTKDEPNKNIFFTVNRGSCKHNRHIPQKTI